MSIMSPTILPEEQALADAGIPPSGIRLYMRSALEQNILDEIEGCIQYDNIPNLQALEDKGVDVRQLILDYVTATLVIDFEGAVL
jgi:hypothetical protein